MRTSHLRTESLKK
jgi:hypothetical protein